MAKLKPIEQLANDVRKGDLVRIFISRMTIPSDDVNVPHQTEYTGYFQMKIDDILHFQNPKGYIHGENNYNNFNQKDNTLDFDDVTLIAKSYEILERAKNKNAKQNKTTNTRGLMLKWIMMI